MAGSMEYVMGKWGLDGLEEGDIVMHNDALNKGSHTPDITLFRPIFYEGELVAIGACAAHHSDTGGMRPSSYCPDADEIYQEGIRFPAVKLFKRGELQQDIMDTYLTNVRGPESERGDLYAQLSTFTVAERGIQELCQRYGGAEGVKFYSDAVQEYNEIRMRERIRQIPEGSYEAEGFVDHDGWEAESWKIKVKVTVEHDPEARLIVDFHGTDPECKGFVKSYFRNTRASVWAAVYAMTDPYIHKCDGCTKPVEIIAPEGTMVNANPPGAIGACTTETGFVVIDVIIEALGKARHDWATGTWGGTFGCQYAWGENPRHYKHPRTKKWWATLFADPGCQGGGAREKKDGLGPTTDVGGGPITMPNVEIMELNYPLLYKYRRLIVDGGGPGKFRGSPTYEALIQPEGACTFVALSNKGYHGAPGVFGGKEGSLWQLEIRDPNTNETLSRLSPKVLNYPCSQDEGIYIAMPGGGGYGSPWERDIERVCEDVLEGYVSIEGAKRDYGVVIDPKTKEVDGAATEQLREEMKGR
jgi:N-methylhydantoinase B/oxoprolinase/acetone carboxylase alpha subunit